MFSVESYLTPYIAAYLGKYVDNFNTSNFQVSLWEGGATFQNVDLNLGAIEAELEIPFQVLSGHIHEMKISVPWTKITSEPIVVSINTFELSLGLRRRQETNQEVRRAVVEPSLPPDTTGYMQGLMNKIVQNAKIVCHNVILKYLEEDIVISLNFENVSLCSVNDSWEQAFVDVGGTDFIVRRKLTCPDLTICLDNIHSVSRRTFMEPLLYKCSFDVRIFNQFQGPFSKVPFFRRLDILFNDLDLSVSEEQIPMLMRLYNLLIALTQLKGPESEGPSSQTASGPPSQLNEQPTVESKAEPTVSGQSTEIFIEDSIVCEEEPSALYDWASWAVGWIPESIMGKEEPFAPPSSPVQPLQPLLAVGLCVNNAHLTLKTTERTSDRASRASTTSSTPSSRIKTTPYLRVRVQGVVTDVVVQGLNRSVRGGFSKLTLIGLGMCPCGDEECLEDCRVLFPGTGYQYLEMGSLREDFRRGTLFDTETSPSYQSFDCRFHCKGYEERYSEEAMLDRTPAVALDSVEILPIVSTASPEGGECCEGDVAGQEALPIDSNFKIAFEKAGPKTSTRIVVAPVILRVSSSLLHRLKVVTCALSAYSYLSYHKLLPLYIPEVRLFLKARLDTLEVTLWEGRSGGANEMRLRVTGVKTHVDVKDSYRKHYFQIRTINIHTFSREDVGGVVEETTSLVLSSTQEVSSEEMLVEKGDVSRAHGPFLALSYIEVDAEHYERSALEHDLHGHWTQVLERRKGSKSPWLLSANQEGRLGEVDVKVGALDMVLAWSTLSPLLRALKDLVGLFGEGKEGGGPYASSNMPLAYLSAQRMRLFFRTDCPSPDTLLLQVPHLNLTSQVENALERRCLRPDLVGYEEEPGVTTLPGSFLEERRYEMTLSHLSLSSAGWGEFQASNTPPTPPRPLFQQSELSLSFSPLLLFHRPGATPILVAGYGAEMNLTRELHLTLSTEQVALVSAHLTHLRRLKGGWDEIPTFRPDPPSDLRPTHRLEWEGQVAEADSGVESTNTPAPQRQLLPLDLFIAAANIRVSLYHFERSLDTAAQERVLLKPLLMLNVLRPYSALSVSSSTQKMEVSVFDLTLGMGSGPPRSLSAFALPSVLDFPAQVFETLPGERNAKTGLLRPFLTIASSDFLLQNLNLSCDIGRPVKFILSKERLRQVDELRQHVSRHLGSTAQAPPHPSLGSTALAPPSQELNAHRLIASIASLTQRLQIHAKQVVVVILEEPPGLPKAALTLALTGVEVGLRGSDLPPPPPPTDTRINIAFESILVSTLIGDRCDLMVNPFGLRLRLTLEWHSFIEVPLTAINLTSDPIRIYVGPQNILAILQVYHSFGQYLWRFVAAEEKELVEILEAVPAEVEEVTFQDDLRNGAFHFAEMSPGGLPPPYQVAICRQDRSMTWRYPHPRSITSVTTHPIHTGGYPVQLECMLSCWCEAEMRFLYVGSFVVGETSGEFFFSDPASNLQNVSSVWRIKLQEPMEEESMREILRPEVLAASLCVKSTFARHRVPKVLLVTRIPRLRVHLLNHGTYTGKIPEERLRRYTLDGLYAQVDHPFATLDLSSVAISASMWMQRARVEGQGTLSMSLTDYAYLTQLSFLQPSLVHASYNLVEEGALNVTQGIDLTSEGLVLKVGSSALHTIISSTLSWIQVLKAYHGDVVDTSRAHFQTQLTMVGMLVANDTWCDLAVRQVQTKKPHPLPSGHVHALTWTTHKVKGEVTLGLGPESVKETEPFALKSSGTLVRRLDTADLFIKSELLHPAQVLVTISGSLDIANALDAGVEVGLLGRRMSQERCWRLESRSHGPSLLMQGREVAGVRFRLSASSPRQHGWSHSLTPQELSALPNQAKCIELYEEREGVLVKLNIWCSLVEEVLDGATRSLILLSPFFRLASLLPSSTRATVATRAESGPQSPLHLRGRGHEVELDFTGDESAAHLLTFQSNVLAERSSPAIPLVAGGGPCMESPAPKPSIDSILSALEEAPPSRKWPFVREALDEREWVEGPRSDGGVKVSFKPWIPGLPSVLVQVKPQGLFVNLTGHVLLFRQEDEDFSIPNRCPFSPTNIGGKFAFGFNLGDFGGTGVLWSHDLEMSHHPSPSLIHHVNRDWRIPMNSFSRLELNAQKQQIHLTIETVLHEDILILTIRPTFSIQNKTKFPLSVSGVSMQGERVGEKDLVEALGRTFLDMDGHEGPSPPAQPLLLFNCDWNPLEETEEDGSWRGGLKYVALKYATSPAWFLRLMKFEHLFDNISAPQGIPVNRLSTALPTTQPHWLQGSPNNPLQVTLPLSVAWTSKDGQVWISIQVDPHPQVILLNDSQVPLCYAEPAKGPLQALHHFPQLQILGPFATAFYAFPSRQKTVSQVGSSQEKVSLVFALSPLPHRDIALATLLVDPSSLEWSSPVKCDDCEEVQVLALGRASPKVFLKVLVEKLGETYYVFLEELSDAEVWARDVRARIQGPSPSPMSHINLPRRSEVRQGINTLIPPEQLARELEMSRAALEATRLSISKSQLDILVGTAQNPFLEFTLHFPIIRVLLIDEATGAGKRREMVSLTLCDLFVLRDSRHGERPLRVLGNKPSESWALRIRLGDLQLDNALFQDQRYDFPVLVQRVGTYRNSASGVSLYKDRALERLMERTFCDQDPLVSVEADFLMTTPEGYETLGRVEVKCQPLVLNLEDKFLSYFYPQLLNISSIVKDRLVLLQEQHQILQAQLLERHSRESLEVVWTREEEPEVGRRSSVAEEGGRGSGGEEVVAGGEGTWESIPSSPLQSPRLRSPSIPERLLPPIPLDTNLEGPLYGDIGRDYLSTILPEEELQDNHSPLTPLTPPPGRWLRIPEEIVLILEDVAQPLCIQHLHIHQVQIYLTFRGTYAGLYFAFDNSPVLLKPFSASQIVTTRFSLGQTLASHFLLGAIYRAGNPVRILASLELIGSPGSLARTLGTGVKDFVVYPMKGLRQGPLAFLAGINSGSSSLFRNVTAGTLTSVTNLAWSVSRNFDRLTLGEEEELLVEEGRRLPINGLSDGLIQGLSAFGIRLLGAIGGVLHHPMQAAIDDGPSPLRIAKGLGKGLIGVVTKPVGATVELVAMTGQGLLQEAGWAHKFVRKEPVFVEEISETPNSLLKYRWKLGLCDREPGQERLLLALEGIERIGRSKARHIALLLTTQNVVVVDKSLDQVERRESLQSALIQPEDFELEPGGATEFFTLLRLLQRSHDSDIFKLFPKGSGGRLS